MLAPDVNPLPGLRQQYVRSRRQKQHLAASHFQFENSEEVRQLQEVFREANRLRMPILIHLHPDDEKWDGRRDAQVFLEQVLPLAPDIPVQVAHMSRMGRLRPQC